MDHAHESRRRTPYVHAFHVEPAFLGRDVLVHAEKEGDEHALEVELEYALTRRLLVVGELPYRGSQDENGAGDVGVGLRGLFVETDRLLVSGQVAVELPTARRDLGADEVVVTPSLLAWGDLGHWITAQAGVALACGTENGGRELSWGAVLAKSFVCRPFLHGGAGGHEGHDHSLTVFLEGRGAYELSGAGEGSSSHEALLGISVPASSGLDLRAGWTLRWDDEDDATSGWVLGFVVHL